MPLPAYRSIEPPEIKAALSLSKIIMDDGHEMRKAAGSMLGLCMFHDERSPSFHVFDDSRFKCFGCGASGDVFQYWQWRHGVDFPQAKRELAQLAGFRADLEPISRAKPMSPGVPREEPPPPVSLIPSDLLERLQEGAAYLVGKPKSAEKIARWRGWPMDGVSSLVSLGLLAAPELYHSQRKREMRVVSFPVFAPAPGTDGTEQQVCVGSHYREVPSGEPLVDANGKSMRPAWYFAPRKCEERGTPGIPALPLVLGIFSRAKLLVVVEGEWDLLTLALAEGWITPAGEQWPEGLCAIGIRGASGVNTFLRYWRRFWPIDAEALLICDNDVAGQSWIKSDRRGDQPFLERVRKLCRRAGAASVAAPHKDLNDAYRAQEWQPGTLRRLLAAAAFKHIPEDLA